MKRKVGIFLVGVSLLAAFGVSARDLTGKEKLILEGVAKQQMKDPDSAKFTWQEYKGGSTYCAHVNGKNAYGGYAGNSLFISSVKTDKTGKIISAEGIIHSDNMQKLMAPVCTDAGYQP